jgi:hypothetical protein
VRSPSRIGAVLVSGTAVAATVAGCHTGTTQRDPPLLVPWNRIGDVALGESKSRVEHEYGPQRGFPQPSYRLHGGKVWVTFDAGRVSAFGFDTPYYRTKSGFGVGSNIPLGPCHRSATSKCEHRWHGFVWNAWVREKPCSCWVKVGLGTESLPASTANFLKPWFFINVKSGRVAWLYFDLKFVD